MTKTLLTMGDMLETHARLNSACLGARDLERSLTFFQWNDRARRLANALLGMGLEKGDRVAILAYNRLEWAELYAATAKAGLIAVPLNFRLSPIEMKFILDDCGASAVIAQDDLFGEIEEIRSTLHIDQDRFVIFGGKKAVGWRDYENLIEQATDDKPNVVVIDSDPWALMYTSGTTGKPKGVIRSHRGMALLSLATEVELGINRKDDALLVMPMCHEFPELFLFICLSRRGYHDLFTGLF